MRHEWTDEVVVAGFGSGEVDFAARLAASPQSVRDALDEVILSTLMNSPDGAVLFTEGHSDVVDGAQDHRTKLKLEMDASHARMRSADAHVLAMIGRDWLSPPPSTWADLPWIAVVGVPAGAGSRLSDGLDEASRSQNRRVALRVCRFVADE